MGETKSGVFMGWKSALGLVLMLIVLVVLADYLYRQHNKKRKTRSAQLRITSRVRGFAELYVDTEKSMFRPAVIPDDDVVAFQRIVAEEHGLDLEYDLLAEMINEEVFRQECTHFERVLTSDRPLPAPVTQETLLDRYVSVYGSNLVHLPYLVDLAKKKHLSMTEGWAEEQIPLRIKEKKLTKHARKIKSAMKHKTQESKAIQVIDLDEMEAPDFISFFQDFFETMGYFVEEARQSGAGAAMLIEKLGEKSVVTVLQADAAVDTDTVTAVLDLRERHKCTSAIVATNAIFTPEAKAQADKAGQVSLWDREKLAFLIEIYQKEKII